MNYSPELDFNQSLVGYTFDNYRYDTKNLRPLKATAPGLSVPPYHDCLLKPLAFRKGSKGSLSHLQYRIAGQPGANEYTMTRRNGKLSFRADYVVLKGHKSYATSRGDVRCFTSKSRRRFLDKMLEIDWLKIPGRKYFITLTYPNTFPLDGNTTKYHLLLFTRKLESKVGKIGYAWKKEYQKRGAPHYHLMVIMKTQKLKALRDLARDLWGDVIKTTDPKERQAGVQTEVVRRPQAAAAYLALYLCKQDQNTVPNYWRDMKAQATKDIVISNSGRWWGFWRMQDVPRRKQVTRISEFQYTMGETLIKEYWKAHDLPEYSYLTQIELLDFSSDLEEIEKKIHAET